MAGRIFSALSVLALTGLVAGYFKPAAQTQTLSPAGQRISVGAAGRGNPWVNLSDGYAVPASYLGSPGLKRSLESDTAQPTTMASGDFDEDGIPDLIIGYATPSSALALHLGNRNSTYPSGSITPQRRGANQPLTTDNGPRTTDSSPFLSPARIFSLPESPDLIGVGDFDADGHVDVVAAAVGSQALYWLPGDGRGELAQAQRIELPGKITALVAGEINRRDGVVDLVVGIAAEDGPQALVLEGPEGALRAKPEVFPLPGNATLLALGHLDDDYLGDLAIAAGSDLLILHGRDRRLSQDEIRQAEVPEAEIERLPFQFSITSLAVGNFTLDKKQRSEIALLAGDGVVRVFSKVEGWNGKTNDPRAWQSDIVPSGPSRHAIRLICANVSGSSLDDLLILDSMKNQLHILTNDNQQRTTHNGLRTRASLDLESEPVTALPMRLNASARDSLVIVGKGANSPTVIMQAAVMTFTVANTNDSGTGSLRQAILDANANLGADTINFNIPGAGVRTIVVTSALPAITDPVVIDAYSQPGASPNTLAVGNNAVLLIELNGAVAVPGGNGLTITAGSSTVRGLVINRFAQNGLVLRTGGGNVITGNFIGTSAAGTAELNNQAGIFIENSPTNTIGGTAPAARNVILGNANPAIHTPVPCVGCPVDTGGSNTIQGNYIGCNAAGTAVLGTTGIYLANANNLIGGTVAGSRNVISTQSRAAVFLAESGAHHIMIQGNYMGVTATGDAVLGSGAGGVQIQRSANTLIGGTMTAARNVIVATGGGLSVFGVSGSASDNVVQGNFIGTNAAGTVALPTGGSAGPGVLIDSSVNNTVGGTATDAGNVIAGFHTGVRILTQFPVSTGNMVLGNFIGTNATGTAALPNQTGVAIVATSGAPAASSNNTIGGTKPGTRNVISGNTGSGVSINGGDSNTIQGNFIGLAADGVTALGNQGHGISIDSGSNNRIGGIASGAGNIVAFNGNFFNVDGIAIFFGTGNTIRGNSIFSNAQLGIDLSNNGVTPNDTGDPDIGPNNLQNFPVITSASSTTIAGTLKSLTGSPTIAGTLNSAALTTFTLDFYSNPGCDPSGNGEGETYLGSTTVATDASGNASFIVGLPVGVPAGSAVTATATDPLGNTSEFSACKQAIACSYSISPLSQSFQSVAGSGTVALTTTAECFWTAVSTDAWITITSGANGSGNGTVAFSVSENTGAARTGTITIAGQTFTVNQSAAGKADLTITKSGSPDPVAPGGTLTYALNVINAGPDAAAVVSVSDALPAQTTFQSFTAPAGWTCTSPSAGTNGTVACTHPSLASNGTAIISIAVQVKSDTADNSTIANTATVSSATADPNMANNSASTTTTVKVSNAVVSIVERITVRDVPQIQPAAMINIAERITVRDVPVLQPAAMVNIAERIAVREALTLPPSVLFIEVAERVGVRDVPALQPAAMINVAERVAVRDVPTLQPAAMINVAERISVRDTPAVLNTLPGSTVRVVPLDGITLFFHTVSSSGTTTSTPLTPGDPVIPPLPTGYAAFQNLAFDIKTTAAVTGPITATFDMARLIPQPLVITPQAFSNLRVLHGESGRLVDRTVLLPADPCAPNFAARTLCARVSSLSPFVIAQLVNRPKILFSSSRDGNFEIYSMNADGMAPTRLTNHLAVDLFPAWSPDSAKIAFTSNREGNFEIYVMNADGSSPARLTVNARVDGVPVWSPDGTKIAFTSNRDGNFEIYSISADGTDLVRLTIHPAADAKPVWSPDGTKIAFTSNRDGNFEIYSINADGTALTRLTNNFAADINPSWSMDGSKIAFASNRDGNFEIYVMNNDGTSSLRVTTNPAADGEPAWSRDGTRIVFSSNRDGLLSGNFLNLEIYMMNADGTGLSRLTNNPAVDSSPNW